MAKTEKTYNIELGNRIKNLRIGASETQKELGLILNKGDSTVRMWELGKSEPDSETIKLIADHYGVSTDYLIGQSNIKYNLNLQLFASDSINNNNIIIRSRDGSTLESELNDDQLEIVKRMIEQFDQKKK